MLKFWELVLGLLVTVGGLIISGFFVWDKRVRGYIKSSDDRSTVSEKDVQKRLASVESELSSLDGELSQLRRQVDNMEGKMSGLATKDDVARIAERVAHSEGIILKLSGQVDTIYRAALGPNQ